MEQLRSGAMLRGFVDYCREHPDERFYQALNNYLQTNIVCVDVPAPGGRLGATKDDPGERYDVDLSEALSRMAKAVPSYIRIEDPYYRE